MNKLVLPSIALAAILATGIMAMAPIQEASAVHTTLLANIQDQDRTIFLSIDAGGDAETNLVILTLGAGDAFDAEGVITSSGTGACLLTDTSGDALITSTVDDAVRGTFTAGAGNFADGEDILITVPIDTTCSIFIHVIEWE